MRLRRAPDILDVERLQRAIQNVGHVIEDDMDGEPRAVIRPLRWFQDIAAEYARLATTDDADGAPFPAGVNRADSEGER